MTVPLDQESHTPYLIPNPPSHILSNGHFVYLPKPTNRERAAFFQRSIVAHNLVSAQKLGGKVDDDDEQVDSSEGDNRNTSSSQSEGKIHPLAIAAARIETLGISELSKSINLGNLVGTEYFDIANIISPESILTPATIPSKTKAAPDDSKPGEKASVSRGREAAYGKSDFTAKQLLDQRFRATFLLKRKYSQLVDAAEFLDLHKRRLEGSLDRQRLIDRRYLQLRKQWRLAAPEHGTRVLGPVRPNEVIAVDVETYDRDRMGGTSHLPNEARRRLARMVPRYATIELEPPSKKSKPIDSSDPSCKNGVPYSLKQSDVQPMDVDGKELDENQEAVDDSMLHPDSKNKAVNTNYRTEAGTAPKLQSATSLSKKLNLITKAEPYAVADPTLGKLDLEFDPDKVPIWTLQLSLMKNSTGFSVSSTLSPVAPLHENFNEASSINKNEMNLSAAKDKEGVSYVESEQFKCGLAADERIIQKDERVIQALQHSLFCASIFDAIRHEIRTANSSGGSSSGSGSGRTTVWLSSEAEEMFFPPTLLMASSPGYHPSRGGRLGFCVAYCQEGEVAVHLDPEYLLTIKLIEVGTAAEASKMEEEFFNQSKGDMEDGTHTNGGGSDVKKENTSSGSQSPEELHTLCRALLLHVQFLYHNFRRKPLTNIKASSLAMSRQSAVSSCACILETCVGFGSKVLFEKKILAVLNVSYIRL